MAGLSQGFFPAADEPLTAGCARLAAEYDWALSEFGPQDRWEPAVAAVVRTLVEATAPMAFLYGPGHAMVYNDRFADLLGARHPRAWGQRASLVMPEIWSRPGYADAVHNVFGGGPAFQDEGEMLDLQGQDPSHQDWVYLARSYSAVRDSDGSVLGVLVVVVEIAPVLVLVGGAERSDAGAATWHGTEQWDETVASQPLIWSGFRASATPSGAAVSEPDQRFVAEGSGQRILPLNGPDIGGSLGYLKARRHLPDIQMVTLAPSRAENDTAGSAAAGEFYDVFGMPDGRLAITIGDVMGAGFASAAIRDQVTVSLRGSASTSSDPNVILTALDELVSHLDRGAPAESEGFGGELFVTALLGLFDPATGDLTLASAGHPPPAVVRRRTATGTEADSEPSSAETGPEAEYAQVEPGPPLGITGTRPVSQIVLNRGDALVGFTKGLLERHARGLAQGQEAVLRILTSMSATAARSISQHLVDSLIGDRGLEHDCALMVVVRDSRQHEMTSVLIPPHAIAVRGARRWARAQLETWGVDEAMTEDAVLCVSELVTNVVLHAGTSARVTMELADRLLVTVEDTGTWSAPRTGREDHSALHGRGLALVAAVSDAMGFARGVEGSTVWFEMAADRART